MVEPQPAKEIETTLGTLTWEWAFVTCLFCYDDNGEPTKFWVNRNEWRCPECGKRGNIRDIPMVKLNGTIK